MNFFNKAAPPSIGTDKARYIREKHPRYGVHLTEETKKKISQTSVAITMINDSNYQVRPTSGDNTYVVTATQS